MTRTPAHELPRVLSAAAAHRLGITRAAVRHRVAIGRWTPIARGVVLTDPGPVTRDDWVLVGMALSGPQAALSGWDAARTYGLGSSQPPGGPVLVLDRQGAHRVVGGVRIRPTSRTYRATLLPFAHPTLPYVPVVLPGRAVADTALAYRSLPPVRALVTSAVQRRVCSPAEIGAELVAGPRNRSGPLRRALHDVLDGARSIAEAEAVELLRRARVPAFEVNVAIVDTDGDVLAVVDILWRELRAVAEIDSREFHFDERDWQASTERHNRLTARSFAVQHYPPSTIRRRGPGWAAEVERWLRARARELGVPYVPGTGPIRRPAGGPPPVRLGSAA